MLIPELLIDTLPANRLYEYNLNYILKEVKDFRDILDTKIDEIILSKIEKVLINFKLSYDGNTETIYLTGGASIG